MRVRLVILVCLALSAAFPTQGSTPYDDPQGRYRVLAPIDWEFTQLNADNVMLAHGACYVSVMVLPGADPATTIQAIARQTGGQWQGFREERHGATRLAGREGVYATYSGRNPRGVAAYLQLIAMSDGTNTYLLMSSAPQADMLASARRSPRSRTASAWRRRRPARTQACPCRPVSMLRTKKSSGLPAK